MRCIESEIEKGRAGRISGLQYPNRLIGDEARRITFLPKRLAVALPVVTSSMVVIPVANASGDVAVEVLEAASLGELIRCVVS